MKRIHSYLFALVVAVTGGLLASTSCESDSFEISDIDPPTPITVEGETATMQGRIYQFGYKDPNDETFVYAYTIWFSGGVASYQEAAGDTELAEWSSTTASGYYKRNGNTITVKWSWTDWIDQAFFKRRDKQMYVDDTQNTLQFESNTYERIK